MSISPEPSAARLYLRAFLVGLLLLAAVVAVPLFQWREPAGVRSVDEGLLGLPAAGLAGQLLALLKNSTPAFKWRKGQWVAETSVTVTQTVTFSSSGEGSITRGDRWDAGAASPDGPEQFLFPMVDERWGVGNQLQEFISAAYTARILNRTLCLANPLAQPKEHKGGDDLNQVPKWSDHFLVDSLRPVVRVRPLEECAAACGGLLEELHFMESYFLERGPGLKYPTWDDYAAAHGLRLGRKVSPRASSSSLSSRASLEAWFSSSRAVACLGTTTFLGLRFREPWRLFYSSVKPSDKVRAYADHVQQQLLGGTPYLALHWRVEELRCRDKPTDHLCFVRCNYGALWAPSLIPPHDAWRQVAADFSPASCGDPMLAVVTGVSVDDFVAAVGERMRAAGLATLFLSTDGFIRGPESCRLVERAIAGLLAHDAVQRVVVLEHCRDAGQTEPTRQAARVFTSGIGETPQVEREVGEKGADVLGALLREHASFISLVEQEVSQRGAVFLGTSESSWSMQVAQSREYTGRGATRLEALLQGRADVEGEEGMAPFVNESGAELRKDELELLSGGACFARQNFPMLETGGKSILGNRSDHWVDYLACEGRLAQGGRCRAECSSQN
ncbi:hypothetical protein KFL_002830150 [Klebsormidium nitens]|uniref:O-fucosyltransferase family protein n=1 Tax=Klebsormidium nitens TaxID=105231 RepID=A0A1Y1IE23_KLENI|nr:hypothetical protein KFL_002830150 [Klebsormidium nitens]|eukprot:GAQ86338.1 hypothetical protein KFL_002830150 [Klebsormidium nitens]